MKKFINKLSKLVQFTYMLLFVITSFLITITIESDIPVSTGLLITYFISTFLTLGKIFYVTYFLED